MDEINNMINKLLSAYLEEKRCIHPIGGVTWKPVCDQNPKVVFKPRIGGYDYDMKITYEDLLMWIIQQDKKPSEIKDYMDSAITNETHSEKYYVVGMWCCDDDMLFVTNKDGIADIKEFDDLTSALEYMRVRIGQNTNVCWTISSEHPNKWKKNKDYTKYF